MNFNSNILILAGLLAITACKSRNVKEEPADTVVKTPVTISVFDFGSISETISLNATSAYQRKNEIKANVNGYIQKVFVNIGDQVKAGDPLFRIKTKEAEVLGQISGNDSLLGIRGEIIVSAPASGIITSITTQVNSYVNDGDASASMADQKSFVFVLHVPYELRGYTSIGTKCQIVLPDSARLAGTITSRLSEVDPASQTQSYIVTPQSNPSLP
ncbi:MAG: HlyD family efflux transporter periplasmic adaptor subunit, partial [Bacteroidia bacterium]|nr:HlyD family efflux transporter periplasmic adaptor subunit [Bacteroidia bacterium]